MTSRQPEPASATRKETNAGVQIEHRAIGGYRLQDRVTRSGDEVSVGLKERLRVTPERAVRHAPARQDVQRVSHERIAGREPATIRVLHRTSRQPAHLAAAAPGPVPTVLTSPTATDSARWLPSTLSVNSTDSDARAGAHEHVDGRCDRAQRGVAHLPGRRGIAQSVRALAIEPDAAAVDVEPRAHAIAALR